jgi:hypothetical protein
MKILRYGFGVNENEVSPVRADWLVTAMFLLHYTNPLYR